MCGSRGVLRVSAERVAPPPTKGVWGIIPEILFSLHAS